MRSACRILLWGGAGLLAGLSMDSARAATCSWYILNVQLPAQTDVFQQHQVGPFDVTYTVSVSMPAECTTQSGEILEAGFDTSNPDYGHPQYNPELSHTSYTGLSFSWISTKLSSQPLSSFTLNDQTKWFPFTPGSHLTHTFKISKTGNPVRGVLQMEHLKLRWRVRGDPSQGGPLATFVFSPVIVNSIGCSLQTTDVSVDLGDHWISEFRGVGSTVGTQPVDLSLSCESDARINIQVDADAEGDPQAGTIKLAAGQDSAAGIGVQLLNEQDVPIPLNHLFFYQTADSDGIFPLKWKARYIQTAARMKAGRANATATVTLKYL